MKTNLKYIIPIFLLSLTGLISIYLSSSIVVDYYNYLFKQVIYIAIGMFLLCFLSKVNFIFIKKYSLFFYFICIILLIYLLIFEDSINGSKSWVNIFGYSFQPSEFTKIFLLLCLDKYIKTKYGFIKGLILFLIPSVLTFLQPDTGTVLFFIIIFFSIFISLGIKKCYYVGLFSFVIFIIFCYFYIYYFNSDLFIDIFGTSFFYRTDRIINFMNNEGYQINNALLGIGNGGVFGNGSKYIIYIPEAITDFMFANILTRCGFMGGLFVIINFIYLDFLLIKDMHYINKNKYFIIGLFGLFLYQQIQHIYMNIALLPITGITLPFISYGGSSLISYYILFGLLLNIKKYR